MYKLKNVALQKGIWFLNWLKKIFSRCLYFRNKVWITSICKIREYEFVWSNGQDFFFRLIFVLVLIHITMI